MATWDFTGTGDTGVVSAKLGRGNPVRILQGRFDLVNASGIGYGDTFAVSDVIKFMTLQAGWVVLAAGINVNTACNSTSTLTLGDSGSSTQYVAATGVSTTGYKTPGVTPKQYTATDYLASTVGTASISTGIVEVWAVVADASFKVPALAGTV